MDLFSKSTDDKPTSYFASKMPLAAWMRPSRLEDVFGQRHILAPDKVLYKSIKADRLSSVIFYGPPGCGKTTLGYLISAETRSEFKTLNAISSGVADIRKVIDEAKLLLTHKRKRTLLFIDEIHRFSRSQQDVLLADVESASIILIGATTHNPSIALSSALLSRSLVFELKALNDQEIVSIILNSINRINSELSDKKFIIDENICYSLASKSEGDARRALNTIDICITNKLSEIGNISISLHDIQEALQTKVIVYDAKGDGHYDHISAFIKSMRGSDPDASVYYLAKMLEAGEDPRFIARRMLIFASEDVGNADPMAICMASACFTATQLIGMPEVRINLSQVAIYLACAEKSNASYLAIDKALEHVRSQRTQAVPEHLKNKNVPNKITEKSQKQYQYPHDYDQAYVQQEYIQNSFKYYVPTDRGMEKHIKARLDGLRQRF